MTLAKNAHHLKVIERVDPIVFGAVWVNGDSQVFFHED